MNNKKHIIHDYDEDEFDSIDGVTNFYSLDPLLIENIDQARMLLESFKIKIVLKETPIEEIREEFKKMNLILHKKHPKYKELKIFFPEIYKIPQVEKVSYKRYSDIISVNNMDNNLLTEEEYNRNRYLQYKFLYEENCSQPN